MSRWTVVSQVDELVAIMGEPAARARTKSRQALLDVDRDWLASSPFCILATAGADGTYDASPKGDPAGQLVHVIDDHTMLYLLRPPGAVQDIMQGG